MKTVTMKKTSFLISMLIVSIMIASNAYAYVLWGVQWQSKSATFYTGYDGGGKYDTAFAEAASSWNNNSQFTYTTVSSSSTYDGWDGKNGYTFSSSQFSIGSSALAVSTVSFDYAKNIIESNIVFNPYFSWDVYHGTSGSTPGAKDFRRVAVHELGHSLGLDHSASTSAIMYPYYSSSIETPQTDDKNGEIAIYGAPQSTPTPTPSPTPTSSPTPTPTPTPTTTSGEQSIVYRGTDSKVHKLWYNPASGWGHEIHSYAADAASDPMGFIWNGQQSIVYRGTDNKVHKLWYDPNSGWGHEVHNIGGDAQGNPMGYVWNGEQGIVYRGTDNKIHKLYYVPGVGWGHEIHEIGGDAAGDPMGFVWNTEQGIVYRGTDKMIHKLYYVPGSGWGHEVHSIGGEAAGDPMAYVWNGEQGIVYRGTDNLMHKLYYVPGYGWGHEVHSMGGAVSGNPMGYVWNGEQGIVYRGTDNLIHKMYYVPGAGWGHEVHSIGGTAGGDPMGYTWSNEQGIVFKGSDSQVHKLWYNPASGWGHEIYTFAGTTAGDPMGYVWDSTSGFSKSQTKTTKSTQNPLVSSGSITIQTKKTPAETTQAKTESTCADSNVTCSLQQSKAIIVAGGGLDATTNVLSESVYDSLLKMGLSAGNIKYLTADSSSHYGELLSKDSLGKAITQWAPGSTRLIVYMMGSSLEDAFMLNNNELLTPNELSSMLNTVGESTTVMVIYDASSSGSFMPYLKAPGRIVITSTEKDKAAWFAEGGLVSFTTYFWEHMLTGYSVYESYLAAKQSLAATQLQVPLLDDSGDGISDFSDGVTAMNYKIGTTKATSQFPSIDTIKAWRDGSVIRIEASAKGQIKTVRAIVKPDKDTRSPLEPVTGLSSAELTKHGSIYSGTLAADKCTIYVYAVDTEYNVSALKALRTE